MFEGIQRIQKLILSSFILLLLETTNKLTQDERERYKLHETAANALRT